ncbi:MAG: TIGR00341 family protein [Sphingomonadaceae bacterium]|uniref:TIGR00341 family protein n=1 Tax=Thermaurantiacus sp. TaxID=2820283 RepID=UPI00298F0720|nr:TIGR00341 family protein [Thermaurantiacus sp.]MCS6986832.1 TIGR00341 family protein [Sphingomonadaceae bacterium]MDW8413905.1 TIGR00341 family protein [Thermaurantiacus sp.]
MGGARERFFASLKRTSSSDGIDRVALLARIEAEASLTGRYAFMVLMSAGIAILGLLLSSPAVIIGAMLVSPLMGPIIGLGFAVAIADWAGVRRSLGTLAAGAALAVVFSALIVFLSPLTDRTGEILARTRPNLFDLLVAVFSALAGGYATIRGRGETIVGVAIATALMPPLAVVGFGLATGDGPVFRGALALFVTNFVAIALSAAVMARVFGFGAHLSREQTRRQGWAMLAVFAALAVPLAVSLREIAWETLTTRKVREEILAAMGPEARIEALDPDFAARLPTYHAIVIVPAYVEGAEARVAQAMAQATDRPVAVRLRQVVAADEPSLRRAASDPRPASGDAALVRDLLAVLAGVPPLDVTVDAERRRAIARVRQDTPVGLRGLRALEERARRRFPGWDLQLVPAPAPLPPIPFADGSAAIADREVVGLVGWALARWRIPEATIEGRRASDEPAELALLRAQTAAELLAASWIKTKAIAAATGPDARAAELAAGRASRRVAVVRLDL